MASKSQKAESTEQQESQAATQDEVVFKAISLDLIDDPSQPMRSEMTAASVEDLVLSIKQVGIIEPLVVKQMNGRYEVIAGHRRLYASKLARIGEVPCYIRRVNLEQTEMLKIHENLYRAEIKPPDEAKHFSYLMDKQKMTPIKISQLISKSLAYVTDRLSILDYPDFLKDALNNGEISFSVAREFARFEDLKQMQTATYYAKRGGMTQEMARKWVQDFKRSKEQPRLQDESQTNGYANEEEVEHTSWCVYCKEGLKLIEAEVVYMHTACLKDVNTPTTQTETPQ